MGLPGCCFRLTASMTVRGTGREWLLAIIKPMLKTRKQKEVGRLWANNRDMLHTATQTEVVPTADAIIDSRSKVPSESAP